MSSAGKSIMAFAVPMAVGRGIELFLRTPLGRKAAESAGKPDLATEGGRQLIRKYSGAAAAIAVGAAFVLARRSQQGATRRMDRVEMASTAGELLLALGSLCKVAADYMRDRRRQAPHPVWRA